MELVCKFGIRLKDGYNVDTTSEWINRSVNRYLDRFNTNYLDVLMIHNPDPKMDFDQVAIDFKRVYDAGKGGRLLEVQYAYRHACRLAWQHRDP